MPTLTLIAIIFTLFVAIALPIIALIYLIVKYKVSFLVVLLSGFTFLVIQIMLRLPLLDFLSNQSWYIYLQSYMPFFIFLILALITAFFEEIGRFIGFKYLLKEHREWKDGVAFGISYGGIEAFFNLGFIYLNYFMLSMHIARDTFDSFLTDPNFDTATLMELKELFITQSSYIFFREGIEQIVLFILHILLSLIVLYSVKKAKINFFIIAILINSLLKLIFYSIPSMWAYDVVLVVVGIIILMFLMGFKQTHQKKKS